VHILSRADLDRQIVKSPTCTITIPEFSLTVPASRGQLTNVEGLIRDTVRDLSLDQPVRKIMDPETYAKIEPLVQRLKEVVDDDDDELEKGEPPKWERGQKPFTPFTIKLDDPAGNSFIQFLGSISDPKWSMRAYSRTREQNASLGLVAEDDGSKAAQASGSAAAASEARIAAQAGSSVKPDADHVLKPNFDPLDTSLVPDEVFNFPGACSSCGHEIMTLMQRVNIPHFKVGGRRCRVGCFFSALLI
jgi:zinc finger protein